MMLSPPALVGAVLLDLLLGDPRWLPHPVVFIGRFIAGCEKLLRRLALNERLAGLLLVVLTVGVTCVVAGSILHGVALIHPLAAEVVGAILGFTCLAARSLHAESAAVAGALIRDDLPAARSALSMIVGRDTDGLSPSEIWRGAVETVAENSSDGVIAPLFFLMLGGPLAALAYKAVNTLDSMVGYKNDRYLRFGWAAARLDDLVNLLPARLTGCLMALVAPLVGLSGRGALRVMLRDGRNHSSPNSGIPEAAAAGALGVQLGGTNHYFGKPVEKLTIGDPVQPLGEAAWRGAVRLMYGSGALLMGGWLMVTIWSRGWP
ncbi:MAG: cobalamin biosynthesis protein CobD [Geobacter sp.]|nr:cobalamin biosynthesis protein CobD [Geobacter sp.]